jgi:rubrerythrin
MPYRDLRAIPGYPKTRVALKDGITAEMRAHHRYLVYGAQAKQDGYQGIAYLYTALAVSELIHAQNYAKVLADLGESPYQPEVPEPAMGGAKENLIRSAESELNSIDKTYPALLSEVRAEGLEDALLAVQYAWQSHQQHLGIINKIRRWSPTMFETVARRIDKRTDRYYVCEVCGSTVVKLPETHCPVCRVEVSRYRQIETDHFY